MYKHQTSALPEALLDIKPWGNNIGVRIPAAVARAAVGVDRERAERVMPVLRLMLGG